MIGKNDDNSNAMRFITAYNTIDNALRSIYNFKRSMSYSDIIRRSASLNYVVRKYEDKLIDYGRLRNAIVHSSYEDVIIAEPHIDVLEEFEKIANLLSTPPKALPAIASRDVKMLDSSTPIADVYKLIYQKGYKNIPIYNDNALIGVANAGKMAEIIGRVIACGEDLDSFVNNTNIGEVLMEAVDDNYYVIVSSQITIEQVMELFNSNRKLLVVLITPNGVLTEKAIGIITVGDVVDMNRILDLY